MIASNGRMLTGSSSFALAISRHSPSWSSNASRVRSVGLDEPQVWDPFTGVDRTLGVPIEIARRVRHRLAHPVRRGVRVPRLGEFGESLAAPARDVRDQDVLAEVQLGLEQDPPSARATAAEPERVSEACPETGLRQRLQRGRPRADIQRSVDDLGDPMRGGIEHVLVRGPVGRIRRMRAGSDHRTYCGTR